MYPDADAPPNWLSQILYIDGSWVPTCLPVSGATCLDGILGQCCPRLNFREKARV